LGRGRHGESEQEDEGKGSFQHGFLGGAGGGDSEVCYPPHGAGGSFFCAFTLKQETPGALADTRGSTHRFLPSLGTGRSTSFPDVASLRGVAGSRFQHRHLAHTHLLQPSQCLFPPLFCLRIDRTPLLRQTEQSEDQAAHVRPPYSLCRTRISS